MRRQELDQVGADGLGAEVDDGQARRPGRPTPRPSTPSAVRVKSWRGAGRPLGLDVAVHEGGDLLGQDLLAVAALGSLGVDRHDVGDLGDAAAG